jgi:hypothetical protein
MDVFVEAISREQGLRRRDLASGKLMLQNLECLWVRFAEAGSKGIETESWVEDLHGKIGLSQRARQFAQTIRLAVGAKPQDSPPPAQFRQCLARARH